MKKSGFQVLIVTVIILAALPHSVSAQNSGASTLRVIPYTVVATTETPVSTLAFTPDGSRLFGAAGKNVIVWNAASLQECDRITEETAGVRSLKFSPDAGSFLSVLDDNTVVVRNIKEYWELVRIRANTENAVLDADFLSDSYTLVVPLDGMTLSSCFVLVMTGNIMPTELTAYESQIMAVDVNKAGDRLLVTLEDGSVHLLSLVKGRPEQAFNRPKEADSAEDEVQTKEVVPAAFFPDGESFISEQDETMLVVRSLTGAELFSVAIPQKVSGRIVFSPDGKSFAVPVKGGSAQIFDSETGRLMLSLKAPELTDGSHEILSAAFSPEGDYLYTGFENGQLIRWTLNSLFISEMTGGGSGNGNGSENGDGGGFTYVQQETGDWAYQLPYVPATVSNLKIPEATLTFSAGYSVLLESYYPGSFDLDICFASRIPDTSFVWGLELIGGAAMPNNKFPYKYKFNDRYGGQELPAPWLWTFEPVALAGYELYNEDNSRLFFDVFAGPVFRFLWDNSFSKSVRTKVYPSVEAGLSGGIDFRGFTAKVSFAYSTQVGFKPSIQLGYTLRFYDKGEKIYEEEGTYEEESISEAVEE